MPLIQKITKKLAMWKAPMLSIGGRVTLINATLTAMPVYMMQTFMMPKWVIKQIDKVRRRFLWHGHKEQNARFMSLASWELVIKTKQQGGLGVKNLLTFNRALLAKIMFQWLTVERPPWMALAQLNTAVTRPWELSVTTPLWKSVTPIQQFLYGSVRFKKGQGSHIKFWKDSWLHNPIRTRYAVLYTYADKKDMTVAEAIVQGNWVLHVSDQVSLLAQQEQQALLTELSQVQLLPPNQ